SPTTPTWHEMKHAFLGNDTIPEKLRKATKYVILPTSVFVSTSVAIYQTTDLALGTAIGIGLSAFVLIAIVEIMILQYLKRKCGGEREVSSEAEPLQLSAVENIADQHGPSPSCSDTLWKYSKYAILPIIASVSIATAVYSTSDLHMGEVIGIAV